MKAVKSTRLNDEKLGGDTPRRGTKLTPNKKSGKERHHLYQSLEEQEDEDDYFVKERVSILDYLDREEDEEYEEDDDQEEE